MLQKRQIQTWENFFWRIVRFFLIFFLLLFLVRSFVMSIGVVSGPSMEPNFLVGNTVFINRLVYLFSPPQRFDVVQIINIKQRKLILKRVIGLPGETVFIEEGKIFISSHGQGEKKMLDESSYKSANIKTEPNGPTGQATFTIPVGSYFLLGDNRIKSTDSRVVGPIPRDRIIGRIVLD